MMAFFKRKRYNIFVKLIAIALFILTLLMILFTIFIVKDAETFSSYENYYEIEIVDHTIEYLDDGNCKITFDVKNTSAYQAYIKKYTIRLEYGNGYSIDNLNVPYPDGYIYDSLNDILVPAGETIKYSMLFSPPEGLRSLRAKYDGESFSLSDAKGKETNYKTYEINLK